MSNTSSTQKKDKSMKYLGYLGKLMLVTTIVIFGFWLFKSGQKVADTDQESTTKTTLIAEKETRPYGLYINGEYVGYKYKDYEFEGQQYQYYAEYEIKPGDRISYYFGNKKIHSFWQNGYKEKLMRSLMISDIYGKTYLVGIKNNHNEKEFNGEARFIAKEPLKAAVAIIK